MRVPVYLAEHRIVFETLVHPPAFTAQNRAKYLAVSGKIVAKCVLLAVDEKYFLAVLPSTRLVDTRVLSEYWGAPVRLASGREVADVFFDCEWGSVPPFGRIYGLQTLLDDAFPDDATLIFEGNSHAEAIRLHHADFQRLEQPIRLQFSVPKTQRTFSVNRVR